MKPGGNPGFFGGNLTTLKFLREKVQIPLLNWLKRASTRRVLWGLAFFALITLILVIGFFPETVDIKEGQVSPETIKAPRAITFEDKEKTELKRNQAAREVPLQYNLDPAVIDEAKSDLQRVFNLLITVQSDPNTDLSAKVIQAKKNLLLGFSDDVYAAVIQASPDTISNLENLAGQIITQVMQPGIKEIDVAVTNSINNKSRLLPVKPVFQQFVRGLALRYVRPNLFLNSEATALLREAARDTVTPQVITILRGEKIIGEGEKVTRDQIKILEALGMQRSRSAFPMLFGLTVFIVIVMMTGLIYLHQFKREIYLNERLMLLLGLLIVITLLVGKGVTLINFSNRPDVTPLVGFLIPVSAGAMSISLLIDSHVAIFATIVLGLFTGIIMGNQLPFTLVAVIGGLVGVYSVSKLSERSDLAKAGIYVALANVVVVTATGMMLNSSLSILAFGALIAVLNGLLSSILTIGSLPYLEAGFGITTSIKLLELSNPNQPLLKRVLLEAPGTYHHSILVGNLAEAAADAVGADSLTVRVGAYYHDIGKLKRPYFFIENQLPAENPHDKLAPSLSTLIITSHIKDGLELARENRLPKVITDIIEQHHGTGLISFFYHKACEADRSDSVAEDDYRYDAPKPQTKEAALVMLADSIEAAVRAMQKPTPGRVEGLVRKLIKEKLHDGQLDESDLTLKDLDIIANAFVRILSGVFHARVEYPESFLKEIERRKANASGHKQ